MTYIKKFSALAAVILLASCNTVEGAGEDLEEAGDRVEEATDDV
jgi:predicted small secreted protein